MANSLTGLDGELSDDTILCRCEEITVGELRRLLEVVDSPEELKRHTRILMGSCQGRMCRNLFLQLCSAVRPEWGDVTSIEVSQGGPGAADLPLSTARVKANGRALPGWRPPVRSVTLEDILAAWDADDEVSPESS